MYFMAEPFPSSGDDWDSPKPVVKNYQMAPCSPLSGNFLSSAHLSTAAGALTYSRSKNAKHCRALSKYHLLSTCLVVFCFYT
jgi:hypothetical protein